MTRPAIPAPVIDALARIDAAGARVGVALSAGADSTLALLETVERLGPARVVALHYDHARRGEESDGDALAAETLAGKTGVAFVKCRRDADLPGDEASLRDDRMRFLRRQAAELGLAAIITGHHADDVAETMLMRLARGSGAAGLAAPRAVSRHRDGTLFLRPLLSRRKQDIIRALEQHGVAWREDSGNAHPEVARRNALRHQVMPVWEKFAGTHPVSGALRSRELLQEDDDALEHWTLRAESDLRPGTREEDWRTAATLPRAVLRRLLHRQLIRLGKHDALAATAFDALLDHLRSNTATTVSIAGGFLRFDGRKLTAATTLAEPARDAALLPAPGAVYWPDGARITAAAPADAPAESVAVLLRTDLGAVLHCAPAGPGARYRPLGAPGSAKIRDMMINRKIPRHTRDALPVISDAHGPLWAPGLVPAARAVESDKHPRALQLTWTPPHAP